MFCNGICGICPNPCFRGEIRDENKKIVKNLQKNDFQTKISPSETGLAVIEDAGVYEIKKSVFGKEKVRRVK